METRTIEALPPIAQATLENENQVKRQELAQQFERLMDQHGAPVVRMASAFERDQASRDDLVQEIALALWRALPAFRGECSERTLVFRIAHNRAATHIDRSVRRRGATVQDVEAHEIADHRPSPEAEASANQLRGRLLDCIRDLPLPHRQVVVLLLEGMSHAEIGEVLGIAEGNVAARATRARAELKERMEGIR